MPATRHSLRLFADCRDEAGAVVLQDRLLELLAAFGPRVESAPVRYWKIPACFEFSIALDAGDDDTATRLQALCDGGWTRGGDDDDGWAVWNRGDRRVFLRPEVLWAELQATRRA